MVGSNHLSVRVLCQGVSACQGPALGSGCLIIRVVPWGVTVCQDLRVHHQVCLSLQVGGLLLVPICEQWSQCGFWAIGVRS